MTTALVLAFTTGALYAQATFLPFILMERVGLTPDNKIIGHFTATGVRSHYSERFKMWGYELPASIFEPTSMGN